MMADTELKLKAVDALVNLHTAVRNAGADNAAFLTSLEYLYLHLLDALKRESPSVYMLLEKEVLSGENYFYQQKDPAIPVSFLMDILLGLGIRDISFDKDFDKTQPHIFIHLPEKSSDADPEQPEASARTLENQEARVEQEDRIYVKMEQNQIILSDLDITESKISESVAEMERVFARLREMDGTIASFLFEEQKDLIKRLSKQVVGWLDMETTFTPMYRDICDRLQNLLQDFITYELFAEANPIVDVFSRINSGDLEKNDHIRAMALEVLRNLASERNMNILFKGIDISEKNKTADACRILCGLGDIVVKKLLTMVRNATESRERIRFIHIIQEMGPVAIPAIRDSITAEAPWYYVRNMAYLLGRIGNEKSVDILKPLLLYKDKRVRMEAFKSISQTGGRKRGELFLSVLPVVDPDLRLNVIEMLGKIKYDPAVADFQDMLKSKTSIGKDYQIALQEKICAALGAIGSPEAAKMLTEVAESKSFLGLQSYPAETRYAARRALDYLKKSKNA